MYITVYVYILIHPFYMHLQVGMVVVHVLCCVSVSDFGVARHVTMLETSQISSLNLAGSQGGKASSSNLQASSQRNVQRARNSGHIGAMNSLFAQPRVYPQPRTTFYKCQFSPYFNQSTLRKKEPVFSSATSKEVGGNKSKHNVLWTKNSALP